MKERWLRVEELYHAALERPAESRAAYLAEACSGDADLLREVESLLEQDATSPLDRPAWQGADSLLRDQPLAPGTALGPYEITGVLGQGGMGRVYSARDNRLGRTVAIKIATGNFGERFRQEARAVAALNHPHICTLYDVGPNYLVMELVEGDTLVDRIRQGPLPLDEALAIARQIAEALEAAHEHGIIHRDLKPANVKVKPNGTVKVIDFGLAKHAHTAAGDPDQSPTVTMTQPGTIVGTASYMSPEQAAGKPVDRRADIWAFGVVLFEMLTGRRLFGGETISHMLADVLRGEIDLNRLPANTPPAIRELIARCLDRKLKSRLGWIGEARVAIESYVANPAAVAAKPAPARSAALAWALAGLLAIAAVGCGWLAWREAQPVDQPRLRFTVDLGKDLSLRDSISGPSPRVGPNVIIAPDESRIAFVAQDAEGTFLFTRRLDQGVAAKLAGTANAMGPFFSPDSRTLGYYADGKLWRIPVEGGSPVELYSIESWNSATWAGDGRIYTMLSLASPLHRLPEGGGAPEPVTQLVGGEQAHRWPQVLPGAKWIVFAAGIPGRMSDGKIIAQRLDSGERSVLLDNATFPRYLAPGWLAFLQRGAVYAAPFDAGSARITGKPVLVLERMKHAADSGGVQMDISNAGMLVYRVADSSASGPMPSWVERSGKVEPLLARRAPYLDPMLAPDGRRFAFVQVTDRTIWIRDPDSLEPRRLTFEKLPLGSPRWTPDGRRIAYEVLDQGVYWKLADGSGQPVKLLDKGTPLWFTPDGKKLGIMVRGGKGCQVVNIEGDPEAPRVSAPEPCLAASASGLSFSEISPDGRWLAYVETENRRSAVFVKPFPDRGGKWQVSAAGGGQFPRWTPDGRKLFYRAYDGRLMVADVRAEGDSFTASPPRVWSETLVQSSISSANYSPAAGGERVLILVEETNGAKPDARVEVVLHFHDEIRRRLAAAK